VSEAGNQFDSRARDPSSLESLVGPVGRPCLPAILARNLAITIAYGTRPGTAAGTAGEPRFGRPAPGLSRIARQSCLGCRVFRDIRPAIVADSAT
jgi:hypothetical protein